MSRRISFAEELLFAYGFIPTRHELDLSSERTKLWGVAFHDRWAGDDGNGLAASRDQDIAAFFNSG